MVAKTSATRLWSSTYTSSSATPPFPTTTARRAFSSRARSSTTLSWSRTTMTCAAARGSSMILSKLLGLAPVAMHTRSYEIRWPSLRTTSCWRDEWWRIQRLRKRHKHT